MTQQIPINSVSLDEMPQEKGLSYDKICAVVGSLYLDSHHRFSIMEDQFNAMIEEYRRQIHDLTTEIERVKKENGFLKNELGEQHGTSSQSSDVG